MSHNNWDYQVTCQDCGHEEMSKTRDVYRCRFCGSRDVDVTLESSFENTKLDWDDVEERRGL